MTSSNCSDFSAFGAGRYWGDTGEDLLVVPLLDEEVIAENGSSKQSQCRLRLDTAAASRLVRSHVDAPKEAAKPSQRRSNHSLVDGAFVDDAPESGSSRYPQEASLHPENGKQLQEASQQFARPKATYRDSQHKLTVDETSDILDNLWHGRSERRSGIGDEDTGSDLWATYRVGQALAPPKKTMVSAFQPARQISSTGVTVQLTRQANQTNGTSQKGPLLHRDLITKWSARDILETVDNALTEFDLINSVIALHRIAKATDRGDAKRDRWLNKSLVRLAEHVMYFVQKDISQCDAKEITKTAWAMAKLCLADMASMDVIADGMASRLDNLDGQGLSNIVWAFATARISHTRLFSAISAESLKKVRDFEPQSLSNVAWALAKVSWDEPNLMSTLAKETVKKAPDFDPQGLANIVWAFATMGLRSQKMMDAIAEEFISGARFWTHQNIANCAWAFAKLGMHHQRVFDAIALETIHGIQHWNPQGLANVVWAFAKLSIQHPRLYDEVERECLHQVDDFNPQNLVNIAWVYAKIECQKPKLFKKIAGYIVLQAAEFHPQHCSNCMWAFATLNLDNRPAIDAIAWTAIRTGDQFCPQDIANVVWSLARLSRQDEELLRAMSHQIHRKAHTFLAQNLSITAYSLSQLAVQDQGLMDVIIAEAMPRIQEFDGQGLSNLAQALAKLGVRKDAALREICVGASAKIPSFTNQELAMFAWSYAKLGIFEDDPLRIVIEETRSRLRELTPQDLSVLVWSYARSGGGKGREVMETLAWEVLKHSRHLIPQDLSTVCWGYGSVSIENREMMDAVAERCMSIMSRFTMQDVANTSWGFAKLAIPNKDLMNTLANEMVNRISECQLQNLSIVAWSFAKIGLTHPTLFSTIAKTATRRAGDFDAQGVANIIWAYGLLEHKDSALVGAMTDRVDIIMNQLTAPEISNIAFGLQSLGELVGLRNFLQNSSAHFCRCVGLLDGACWADMANISRSIAIEFADEHVDGISELQDVFRRQLLNPTLECLKNLLNVTEVSIADSLTSLQLIIDANGLPYLGEYFTREALIALKLCSKSRGDDRPQWVSQARQQCRKAAGTWKIPASDTILAYVSWSVECDSVQIKNSGKVFKTVITEDAGDIASDFLRPLRQHLKRDMHPERLAFLELLREANGVISTSSFLELRDCSGIARLYVMHYPCISCLAVFCQFRRRCPNITVEIEFDSAWTTFCGLPRRAKSSQKA